MKLKYYLRGLGIGIIVTTIILMISFSMHKEELSDEQIIARAEALGMEFPEDKLFPDNTEGTETTEQSDGIKDTEKIKDTQKTDNTEGTEASKTTDASETVEKEEASETEKGSEAESEATDKKDTEASEKDNSETMAEGQPVPTEGEYELNIKRGDVCRDICDELFQNGLVADSEAFRVYLGNVGYASNMSVGKYKIPYGLSYEEIYNILKAGPIEEQ